MVSQVTMHESEPTVNRCIVYRMMMMRKRWQSTTPVSHKRGLEQALATTWQSEHHRLGGKQCIHVRYPHSQHTHQCVLQCWHNIDQQTWNVWFHTCMTENMAQLPQYHSSSNLTSLWSWFNFSGLKTNEFLIKLGISDTWSQRELISWHKFDATKHCRMTFMHTLKSILNLTSQTQCRQSHFHGTMKKPVGLMQVVLSQDQNKTSHAKMDRTSNAKYYDQASIAIDWKQ